MTTAEWRELINRELALTIDLETREVLRAGLDAGPGTTAWVDALDVIGLRATVQAIKSAPSREDGDRIWARVDRKLGLDRELDRRRRRGKFVALVARLMLAALVVATGFLLAYWGIR